MITWVGSAAEVECVILMVAGTGTTGCYTVIEMEPSLSFVHWEASLKELNCRELSQTTQPQLTRTTQAGMSSSAEMTTLWHR